MIDYNTEAMHNTAKTIQTNADNLQSNTNNFWGNYQNIAGGTLPVLNACLAEFMDKSKAALTKLVQARVDLGTKLEHAASLVDQDEQALQKSFQPNIPRAK